MKTKFELEESVYFIFKSLDSTKITSICDACEGVGTATIGHTIFNCSKCGGKGNTSKYKGYFWKSGNYVIRILSISLHEGNIEYSGDDRLDDYLDWYDEQDLFSTRKEAQEECDRRNKNEIL